MHRLGEPKLYVPVKYFEPINVEFPDSDTTNNESNSQINESNNDTVNEFTNVSASAEEADESNASAQSAQWNKGPQFHGNATTKHSCADANQD